MNAQLNKELQIFRNHVKQVREQLIQKLVRDKKFWSEKAARQPELARAKSRSESRVLIIEHIKTLSPTSLTKAILRNVPSTGSQSIEERTLAMFRQHKKLASEIEALIRVFQLNEKGEVLDKFFRDRTEKSSKKSDDGKTPKNKKKITKSGKKCKEKPSAGAVENGQDDETSRKKSKKNQEKQPPKAATSQTKAKGKEQKVAVEDESDSEESEIEVSREHHERDMSEEPPELKKQTGYKLVVDSFFKTASGKPLMVRVPIVENADSNDDEEGESWKRANKKLKAAKSQEGYERAMKGDNGSSLWSGNRQNKSHHEQTFANRETSGKSEALHPSWAAKRQQKGIKPFTGQKLSFDDREPDGKEEADNDLHPSWAAKRQQKGIKPFTGQKISFGDGELDGKEAAPNDLHPSWAAKRQQKGIKPFTGQKISFDDGELDGKEAAPSDLHPSWAAKRQQKGIKPFTGQKISFNDKEPDGKKVTDNDLHPSWAAKQRQKGIHQFNGTKKTFEESVVPSGDASEIKRAHKGLREFSSKKIKLDDTAKPVQTAIASDLHPSWAAKKSQKGIKPFEGKKVVFD